MSRLHLSVLVLVAACERDTSIDDLVDTIEEVPPAISATPDEMDFGLKAPGALGYQPVTVTNTGGGILQIDALEVRGSDAVTYNWLAPFPFTLGAGQSFKFDVRFQTYEDGAHEADVVILSNASNAPELPISVRGASAGPRLVFDPGSWTVGPLPMGCPSEGYFRLENRGSLAGTVADVRLEGDGAFQVGAVTAMPVTLEPGQGIDVVISEIPLAAGVRTASLIAVGEGTTPDSDPVALSAEHHWDGTYEEVYEAPENTLTDIFLAVDQSSSMADQQALLAEQVPYLAERLRTLAVDWRLGVVTQDDGCFNAVFDATSADLEAQVLAAIREGASEENLFTEALMELVSRAIFRDTSGLCNAGFHRTGAVVHAIYVSDEDDQSALTWSEYLAELRAYAGGSSLAYAHVIGDIHDVCGAGNGADGYYDIAVASNGLRLDICADDWSPLGDQLAAALAVHDVAIPLEQVTIDVPSIEVTVDGARWTSGWHYESRPPTVVVDEPVPAGSRVVVRYQAAGACP